MDVTFVIPVRNDARRLARCLSAVRRELGGAPGRIVVVDNGSVDDSADVARAAGARVVAAPAVPVAAARNRGVDAEAAGDVLAFVDADHELLPGWFAALRAAMARPEVWGAAAAYHGPPTPTPTQRWYDAIRGRTIEGPIEWAGAGNLALRREAFERVGGFNEGLEACEDVDLCFRIRQAGGTLWGAPGMASVHHGDPASLGHLFRGELWRGRDNIRVSLRGPKDLRSLLSMALPVVHLLAAPLALGLALSGWPRLALAGALATWLGPATLRTVMLWRRQPARDAGDAWHAWAVCLTYDAARALALVWHVGHHSEARVKQAARGAAGAPQA